MRISVVWPKRDRLQVGLGCILRASQVLKGQRPVVVERSSAGSDRDGTIEMFERLRMIAALQFNNAKQVQAIGIEWLLRKDLDIQRRGLRQVALLMCRPGANKARIQCNRPSKHGWARPSRGVVSHHPTRQF